MREVPAFAGMTGVGVSVVLCVSVVKNKKFPGECRGTGRKIESGYFPINVLMTMLNNRPYGGRNIQTPLSLLW